MTETQADILAVLQKQEAVLFAALAAVRKAIQAIQSPQPAETGRERNRGLPVSTDALAQLMERVLAELGPQFTSADIFEQARKLNPDLDRAAIKPAVKRLQRKGAIPKLGDRHGWRPARFQKPFLN
jgi:hypothetical protein